MSADAGTLDPLMAVSAALRTEATNAPSRRAAPTGGRGILSTGSYLLAFGFGFAKAVVVTAVRGESEPQSPREALPAVPKPTPLPAPDVDAVVATAADEQTNTDTEQVSPGYAEPASDRAHRAAAGFVGKVRACLGEVRAKIGRFFSAISRPRELCARFWHQIRSIPEWLRARRAELSTLRTLLRSKSDGSYGLREYALVTISYWTLMLTDGAIRMLVLFFFLTLGYSPLQIALLFLFYEVFGVITNLVGGWVGAKFGLRITLFAGLAFQIAALVMMALVTPSWSLALAVPFVMLAQALSGIAKDLTKMSSKSSLKLVVSEGSDATMFKWVSVLTGSKNALKGVGFFLGCALLMTFGFNASMLIMAAGLSVALVLSVGALPHNFGQSKKKVKFTSMFSMSRRINLLSAARLFLFGARDVWFVVGLPIYLAAVMGWSPLGAGAYIATWVIGYGYIQARAPAYIRSEPGRAPDSSAAQFWTYLLAAIPAGIAVGLSLGFMPGTILITGLSLFGVVFAIDSAIHSYLIVAYSELDDVSMNVGFYYMANAGGRLLGTVLSGWAFQSLGMVGCLWISSGFLLAAGGFTSMLALPQADLKKVEEVVEVVAEEVVEEVAPLALA